MKIISVSNLKGGCGKSLVAYSLASMLTKSRKRVLLMDIDPQSNLSLNCGINNLSNEMENMVDIFETGSSPSNVVIEKPITDIPNLDLISSTIALTKSETLLVNMPARELILKHYLEKHSKFFSKYDYILIDTAPNLGFLNLNAFIVSDSILLVTDVGLNGFSGCNLFIDYWTALCLKLRIPNNIKGILINRFDKRTKVGKDLVDYISKNDKIKDLVLDTIIPENVKLKETETVKIPIAYYDTNGIGAKAFKDLYKELKTKEII